MNHNVVVHPKKQILAHFQENPATRGSLKTRAEFLSESRFIVNLGTRLEVLSKLHLQAIDQTKYI